MGNQFSNVQKNSCKIDFQLEKTSIENKNETTLNDIKSSGGSYWADIRNYYKFKKILGSGKSKVRLANYKLNGKQFAIKSINKKDLNIKELNRILNEIELLTIIYHPFIIKLVETYQDKYYLHIVTEYCDAIDLYDCLIESKETNFDENKIREILKSLLIGLNFCHKLDISHRDIKPENILINNNCLKLVDFGFSRRTINEGKLHTIIGTPFYIAPEVLKGEYTNKCDIWSVGIIAYILFYGKPPFLGDKNIEIYHQILNSEVKLERLPHISKNALNFIGYCLEKNPDNRLSSIQALQHPFINEILNKENIQLSIGEKDQLQKSYDNMRNFFKYQQSDKNFVLKKMIYKYLMDFTDHYSERDLVFLNKIFFICDYKYEGYMSMIRFFELLDKNNISFTEEDKASILRVENIDYFCFLIYNFNLKDNYDDYIKKAFNYFDLNSSNYIEFIDIKNILLRNGKHILNDGEITKIIREASNNEKVISYQNFKDVIRVRP